MSYIKKNVNIKNLKCSVDQNISPQIIDSSKYFPITGTIVTYSPPNDAVNVCYETQFYIDDYNTNHGGLSFKLMSGTFGDAIDNFSELGSGYYASHLTLWRYKCDIFNYRTYIPSWSGEKTILLAVKAKNSTAYRDQLHQIYWFSGSSGVGTQPVYPHVMCYSITE